MGFLLLFLLAGIVLAVMFITGIAFLITGLTKPVKKNGRTRAGLVLMAIPLFIVALLYLNNQ